MSPLRLIRLQTSTLFVCDPDGHLRYVAEPGYAEPELEPAPRFFMGRTAEGNAWAFRHDLPETLSADLERLCRLEPVASDFGPEPRISARVRDLLEAQGPVAGEERGPAYWLPEGVQASGAAVLVDGPRAELLEAHFPWYPDSRRGFGNGPVAASLEGGVAVSICYCARFTQVAAEAGLETAEAFRGRGHGAAAAALWARAVRRSGRVALYSTSWDNRPSRAVARKLGAVLFAEDWSLG